MITHRPATLGPITHVAVMQNGRIVDFGDREAVMQRTLPGGEPATPGARPAPSAPGRLAQESAR
jgi:ATP-binding cassette subfamily C protein